MKTLKIAMITAFLAIAMVHVANADGLKSKPTKKVINLTLEQAIQVPGLVGAMLLQLDNGFLTNNQQSYTVTVNFNNYVVRITGTYEQWALFFKYHWSSGDALQAIKIDDR